MKPTSRKLPDGCICRYLFLWGLPISTAKGFTDLLEELAFWHFNCTYYAYVWTYCCYGTVVLTVYQLLA